MWLKPKWEPVKLQSLNQITSINYQIKVIKTKVTQSDLSFNETKWSWKYGNQECPITIFEHNTNVLYFCCTLRVMYHTPFQLLLAILLYLQIYFPWHTLLSPNTEFTVFTVSMYFHCLSTVSAVTHIYYQHLKKAFLNVTVILKFKK